MHYKSLVYFEADLIIFLSLPGIPVPSHLKPAPYGNNFKVFGFSPTLILKVHAPVGWVSYDLFQFKIIKQY
jgi:hypothetical protein